MIRHIQSFLHTTLAALPAVAILFIGVSYVHAEEKSVPPSDPMLCRIHGPESVNDVRYNYFWEVLRAAMEKTRATHGDYRWEVALGMSHQRQVKELQDGGITVLLQTASVDLEKAFTPVRIPVDKGILGYRVFLIRKADAPKFAAVKTVEDLKKFSVGQGAAWQDVAVWKHNGFKVVEGSSYQGLFHMLEGNRFDFFSRGINEVTEEYDLQKAELPGIAIEESLCVYYPWPRYFYCADSEAGRRLAARIEAGITAVFADHSVFDPIFKKYHGESLRRLNLKSRRILRIENPTLPAETPVGRREFWYDPFTEERAPASDTPPAADSP